MRKLSGNTNRIYEHLKKYGTITSLEAINLYGATRLSAIIFNLKKYGCKIESVTKFGKNRWDEKTRFAEYRLISEE